MFSISISLSEAGRGAEISEVRVDGVIDTLTAGEFEEVLDTLIRRGRYRVIIDLAGVDYVSSAGWGIFISHIRDVRDNSGDIKLANMIPNVFEIYELLEFDNVLQAFTTLDDARADFEKSATAKAQSRADVNASEVRVVETPAQAPTNPRAQSAAAPSSATSPDAETLVLSLVKEDPFFSISEMLTEIKRRRCSEEPGWWTVFSVLRNNKLLRKRSRFRFSQGRR